MTFHYQGGGTLSPDSELYISRQADKELLELCQKSQFTYILAPRQIGKSSLMLRTAQKLSLEGIKVVKLDLTRLGTQVEAEGWYYGFMYEVRKQLELKLKLSEWWEENKNLSLAQRLTLFFEEVLLCEVTAPVIIFVDEIDTTLSLSFTDDFFASIRGLYVARAGNPELKRLSFVLIGVATPGDLIRDPKRTPFNIGQRVEMTDFTFEEALPLAGGLGLPNVEAQETLKSILEWTGGHPYLTQRLCQVMAEQSMSKANSQIGANLNTTPIVVAKTFLGEKSEEDNNLQFVRDMLTRRAPDLLQVLSTYREVRRAKEVLDQEQSIVKSHLKLSGVVKRERGRLLVRNQIYKTVFDEKWIKEHLPINWAKRLKQALGVIAATLLLALIMGGLAIYAFIQQDEAGKQADEANKQRNTAETRRIEAETARNQSDRLLRGTEAQALAFRSQTQTDPELALLLTIEAAQRIQDGKLEDSGGQVEAALRQALANYTPNIALRSPATATNSVAFSPDGKRLVVAGNDGYARVYETGTNKEIMSLGGKFGSVYMAKYSPDGSMVATADAEGNTIFYETASGKQLGDIITCQCFFNQMAFSPDGKMLAEGPGNRTARILDPIGGKVLWEQFDAGGIYSPVFSPNGKWLAIASGNLLFLWDLTSGTIPPKEPYHITIGFKTLVTTSAIFSPDSRWLILTSTDFTARIIDTTTGKYVATLKHNGFVNNAVFTPDGKQVLTASSDKTVKVWETESGKELLTFQNHTSAVQDVILSPDGKLAISTGNDTTIRVWDYVSGKEVTVLRGHASTVASAPNHAGLSFSPDGKWLASTSSDGTARLWDWEALSQKRLILNPNTDRLLSASYSPDGKTVFTVANNNPPRLFDSASGKQLLTLQGFLTNGLGMLQFYPSEVSPDGKLAVTSGGFNDQSTRIWEVATGKELGFLDGAAYTDYVLAKNSLIYADVRKDLTIEIRDLEKDSILQGGLKGHQAEITGMAFSPDYKLLGSASKDQTARIWEVATGKEVAVLKGHNGAVTGIEFSPDGKYVVTAGEDKTLRLWDTTNWQEVRVIRGHTAEISSVAFSPDGQTVISGSADKTARIWEVASGKELLVLSGHSGGITSLAVSEDGKRIATASEDGTARVWDAANGTEQMALRGHSGAVTAVFFKPDGSRIYTGGADKTLRLWDSASGKEMKITTGFTKPIKRLYTCATFKAIMESGTPVDQPIEDPVWVVNDEVWRIFDLYYGYGYGWVPFVPTYTGAIFSPDSKLVATGGSDGVVRLWDSATGKLVRTLEGHTNGVLLTGNGGFSPDGQRIVAGGGDSIAIVWEVVSGKQLLTLTGHSDGVTNATFSPDGKLIVTAGADNTARVWDATTGKQLLVLKGHTGALNTARFSPDGKFIITASADSTARIWDTASGQLLAIVLGHNGPVSDANFSPDGKNILTASEDFTAIIQPCDICGSFSQALEQAKNTVTRSLTPDEKAQFGIATAAVLPLNPVSRWSRKQERA
ncbi:MAG: AAA-like domain-containing protein [Chloroflexi bacterium]|uniref:AAA-like domain-containing protein n=1 Tax=Candidatus Chlorohelix allophototropha TaxID=3003348 RepID=A0A8T7M4E0_9CHLR|nr:AAA-like domain-containing protein [Chloroflexota bacterium]WJW70052.1 AAA-like domain-containing protein [Chloroflexota bacterium L227-S17]